MSKISKNLLKKPTSPKKQKKIQIKMKSRAKNPPKLRSKSQSIKKRFQERELIVIDEGQGLIFENEKTLFGFFNSTIEQLEGKYQKHYRSQFDFTEEQIEKRLDRLEETLDDPDEIWISSAPQREFSVHTFVRHYPENDVDTFFVACAYLTVEEKQPTFIFTQFCTKDTDLLEHFREDEIIFHRKLEAIQFAAIEGDSLLEGDFLAIGLLESMLKLRSEKDIPNVEFQKYAQFREEAINNPDEIWKQITSDGHILVTFIKDISDQTEPEAHYVVVCEEDESNQVHSLLFSFPTRDLSLLERYQQGENLEADEVVTESSH